MLSRSFRSAGTLSCEQRAPGGSVTTVRRPGTASPRGAEGPVGGQGCRCRGTDPKACGRKDGDSGQEPRPAPDSTRSGSHVSPVRWRHGGRSGCGGVAAGGTRRRARTLSSSLKEVLRWPWQAQEARLFETGLGVEPAALWPGDCAEEESDCPAGPVGLDLARRVDGW